MRCPHPRSAAGVAPPACSILSRWSGVHLGLAPSPESLDINMSPQMTSTQCDRHWTALPAERREGVQLQLPLTGRNTCVRAASVQHTCLSPCSAAGVPAAGRQEERDVCRKGTDVTFPVQDSVKEEKRQWHPGRSVLHAPSRSIPEACPGRKPARPEMCF